MTLVIRKVWGCRKEKEWVEVGVKNPSSLRRFELGTSRSVARRPTTRATTIWSLFVSASFAERAAPRPPEASDGPQLLLERQQVLRPPLVRLGRRRRRPFTRAHKSTSCSPPPSPGRRRRRRRRRRGVPPNETNVACELYIVEWKRPSLDGFSGQRGNFYMTRTIFRRKLVIVAALAVSTLDEQTYRHLNHVRIRNCFS